MTPAPTIDPYNAVAFFVDDYRDNDPRTVDSNPGQVNGQPLKLIAVQYQRTWSSIMGFGKGPAKNWIYRLGDSRMILYKLSPTSPGVVIMGFSIKRMEWHPDSVPMETYAKLFLDKTDAAWLERNNFVLVK